MGLLITAKEAKEKSEANQQTALDLIAEQVLKAANNGDTAIVVYVLSDFASEELQKAGYQIGMRTSVSNSGVRISW